MNAPKNAAEFAAKIKSLRAMTPAKRRRAFSNLTPLAQEAVTVPCHGEAHTNAFIDSCCSCANYSWGRMLAAE